ncbi:hypothetical protein FRX31_027911 [Thalictrum thalictroides]|uniref:Uncharacterized protein n=1 Tax=Thalictrum thalictroides TaxID=46969 RepID=A0A7J6USH6_THATH|nr:hypothetical protein FRX31_034929 [Thalictrum thalictroides]KAF5182505.1 hypothetical protein FRX31_027911 [Thalictrum thalictroides]
MKLATVCRQSSMTQNIFYTAGQDHSTVKNVGKFTLCYIMGDLECKERSVLQGGIYDMSEAQVKGCLWTS